MTITHLIFALKTGGSETMLVDIVNEQMQQVQVNIIIINEHYNQALIAKIYKGVGVYFINRKEGNRSLLPFIRLNILLLKLRSDVLHCHNHNIIPILIPALKKKTVFTVHDVNICNKYFKKYSKLFAISKIVKEDIKTRSGLLATLVYNGICIGKMLQKEKLIKNNIYKVVVIGRLEHTKKGQHLVIEALNLLKVRGFINIQLDFIGTGNSELYLQNLAVKNELTDQVKFLGLKERDYIYTHLKDYDLLIQPSLFEGFGLTVVEGMAAKVPVLVSNIDGPIEIIENGKYGFSFQSGDSGNLAEVIQNIMSNYSSEQLKKTVEFAYLHVKNNFEIAVTASKYIESYKSEL